MDCLSCQLAQLQRQNAALRGAKHWEAMPERCELHGALASARVEHMLRTAQALHEDLDRECRATEKAKTERVLAGKPAVPYVIPRVLSYPFGHPNSRNHPSKLPLQGETTLACLCKYASTESKRAHEISLLAQAVASGKVRRVG